MAAPALTAASSMTVLAIGGVANLAASNKPLQAKSWLPNGGGFIGVINGRSDTSSAVADPDAAPKPTSPSSPTKKIHPIGGRTDKPAPPCPFGRFPKHKPSKLPGPPTPYDPAKSP